MAEYKYNEKLQLIRRDVYDLMYNNEHWYNILTYNNLGKVEKYEAYATGSYHYFDLLYDSLGRIKFVNNIEFRYNSIGQISGCYFDNSQIKEFLYDENSNVITESSYEVNSDNGNIDIHNIEFEYDNMPKPTDNIDYFPRPDPLPLISKHGYLAGSLSKNNITKIKGDGFTYSYKYNEVATLLRLQKPYKI